MASTPRFVEAAGHRLAVIDGNPSARGAPVVFIHGILASVAYSEVVLPDCLRQRRWFALSLPGHFPAETPVGYRGAPVSTAVLKDILTSALHTLVPGEACVLVGHSTGGLWSILGAGELPRQVHAVCTLGGFAQGKLTGVLGLTQKIARAGALGRRLAELNLYLLPRMPAVTRQTMNTMIVDRAGARSWPPVGASLTAAIDGLRQGVSADYVHLLAGLADLDVSASAAKIRQPCLIIHGENDPIVPFAQAQLLAQLIAHAERAFYPGVGHLPYAERAQQVEQDLGGWLQRIGA